MLTCCLFVHVAHGLRYAVNSTHPISYIHTAIHALVRASINTIGPLSYTRTVMTSFNGNWVYMLFTTFGIRGVPFGFVHVNAFHKQFAVFIGQRVVIGNTFANPTT